MKVIITGGSGLIGTELTKHLTDNGYEVVILSRNPAKVTSLPKGARAVQWDGVTTDGWASEVEGAAAIVNFAGENLAGTNFFPSRWTEERRLRIRQSRLDAGQAVVEAVRQAKDKPGVVIQSSAIGYYGPQDDEAITEAKGPADDFLAQTCVLWEDSTREVESMGVRRVVIRGGIYLSPDDGALFRMLLPYRLFAGGPFGNGKQFYSWIHPADHVGAVRFLIENKDASGVYNLTAPQPERNKDFGKTLGKVLNRPSLIPLPGFVMKLMFGDVSMVVLEGQRVLPKNLQDARFGFKYPDLESALKDLLEP